MDNVLKRFFVFVIFLFLFCMPADLIGESCPEEAKEGSEDTKRAEQLFSGEVQRQEITEDGQHYFGVRLQTDLPPMTRVKLHLYYVRGTPSIDYLAYRTTVRVEDDGSIQTRLMGLDRPIWAGCYKLVVELLPEKQVPSVKEQLPNLSEPVRRHEYWYHGTKEQLEKQRENALEAARRDLRTVLYLSEQLKHRVASFRKRRKNVSGPFPFAALLRMSISWEAWSKSWMDEFESLKASNERRPRFKGRTIPFNFVEDRTAYFLGYDIQDLRELYELARKSIRPSDSSQQMAQRFRKKHRLLRNSVTSTMVFLNLVVPLTREGRKRFKNRLGQLENVLTAVSGVLNSAEQNQSTSWRDPLRERLQSALSIIFQLNPDLPDMIYHRYLDLGKRLDRFSRKLPEQNREEAAREFKAIRNEFLDVKQMSLSYIKSSDR